MFQAADGQMVAKVVQWMTGAALLLYLVAYAYRIKNRLLHVATAITATVLTLLAAAYLITNVHFYGNAVTSDFPFWMVQLHRLLASVTAVLMLTMGFSGITRRRNLHIKLHKIFLVMYILIFISGWILFVR